MYILHLSLIIITTGTRGLGKEGEQGQYRVLGQEQQHGRLGQQAGQAGLGEREGLKHRGSMGKDVDQQGVLRQQKELEVIGDNWRRILEIKNYFMSNFPPILMDIIIGSIFVIFVLAAVPYVLFFALF